MQLLGQEISQTKFLEKTILFNKIYIESVTASVSRVDQFLRILDNRFNKLNSNKIRPKTCVVGTKAELLTFFFFGDTYQETKFKIALTLLVLYSKEHIFMRLIIVLSFNCYNSRFYPLQ